MNKEDREGMTGEVIDMGWNEDISWGELAYLEGLSDAKLTALYNELNESQR